jgi:hypothetical protein
MSFLDTPPRPAAPALSMAPPPAPRRGPLARFGALLRALRQRLREEEEIGMLTAREMRDMGVDHYDLAQERHRLGRWLR